MLHINNNTLKFEFPEIHREAVCNISLHRTTAVARQSVTSLVNEGIIPLFHIDDYSKDLPLRLLKRGGVIAPAEKEQPLYIKLSGNYPFALKIGVGKINAVSGCPWSEHLNADNQDYLVTPPQSSFAGYHEGNGRFHQFVVTALGKGATIEEQVAGTADIGGIQIIAYPMKRTAYEDYCRNCTRLSLASPASSSELGIAKGDLIAQKIATDTYGSGVWEMDSSSRCFVHLLEKSAFRKITGRDKYGHPAKIFSLDRWRRANGR